MDLDALLRRLGLPTNLALVEREDIGRDGWAAGWTSYQDAAGGYVQASLQPHPPRGLTDPVFTYGGSISIESWDSGSEYVVREPDVVRRGFAQVIVRRLDGAVLLIAAGGIPGKNVPRPMSRDDLLTWHIE